MRNKRFIIAAIAVLLVITAASTGTLAFLTTRTEKPVTNTFIAAGEGKLADSMAIIENAVKQNADGSYSLTDEISSGNSYDVLPGATLPKNPRVTVTGKTTVPSYLYVEVLDGLEGSALSYEMADHWLKLNTVNAVNGGTVYVYTVGGKPAIVTDKTDLSAVSILKDDVIKVANQNDLGIKDSIDLSFYAYLAQASAASDSAAVFNTCFG